MFEAEMLNLNIFGYWTKQAIWWHQLCEYATLSCDAEHVTSDSSGKQSAD